MQNCWGCKPVWTSCMGLASSDSGTVSAVDEQHLVLESYSEVYRDLPPLEISFQQRECVDSRLCDAQPTRLTFKRASVEVNRSAVFKASCSILIGCWLINASLWTLRIINSGSSWLLIISCIALSLFGWHEYCKRNLFQNSHCRQTWNLF